MPAAVKVRVPATVANLGPGFDTLGVAVRMHLEVEIEPRRDTVEIMVEGEGAEHLPVDDQNLAVRSATRCACATPSRLRRASDPRPPRSSAASPWRAR